MVSSPMYERLMRFVEAAKANESLAAYDGEHSTAMDAINGSSESIRHLRDYQGFEGAAGTAINGWLQRADNRVAGWRASFLSASQIEVEMRRVMRHAREEAERLSPVLVDARLDSLRQMAEVTIPVLKQFGIYGKPFNAVAATGAALYDAIAAQANAQREANAADILTRLNEAMQALANLASRVVQEQQKLVDDDARWSPGNLPQPSSPATVRQLEDGYKWVSPHDPGMYPGDRDSDYGRSSLRSAKSGLYPAGFDDPDAEGARMRDAYKLQSRRIHNRFNTEGQPGTRTNPITNPQDLMDIDLLHTRVGGDRHTRGTIGGYTPAPPTDRDHPLWRINGGPGSDTAGHLAGALGAGALGARAAGRMAAGTNLQAGTYSGTGYGTYTPPGADTPASGAAGSTAGRVGMGGFMGGAGAAGAGGLGKGSKKARRRTYEAFKYEDDVEDDLPEGYVNPMSQTYGSDQDIAPAPRKDDGWDPRQW